MNNWFHVPTAQTPIFVLFLSVGVLFDGAFFPVSILNLDVPTINQVSFGGKSLRYYGPKNLNSLSFHIKSFENLEAFINIIKNWNGVSFKCKVCQYYQVLANYFKWSEAHYQFLQHLHWAFSRLTSVTESSILDVVGVLDPSL